MFGVTLGYLFIFLSVCLQIYYLLGWAKKENKKKIVCICKVIIFRTLGIISGALALITTVHGTMFLYAVCSFAFGFLLYDVWRLKLQVDETVD